MTTASPHSATRGAGLASVLEILRRRRALALVPFLFVLAAAASLAIVLPGLWTARAVIMVDRQQVPETMVKSTVTGEIEGQLITLSQAIMSPDRLAVIIERYNLYPELRAREGMEAAVGRMRRDIAIDFGGSDSDRRRREPRTVLFSVAYSNSDPRVTADVANELAGLYVAENVRYREQAAAGTTEFLDKQLAELRPRLVEQERRIAAYKEQYLGELPEQKEANLRTLERLQQQLMLAHENNRRANERRQLITQSLSQLDTTVLGPARGADVSPAAALAGRLNILRQELAQLQSVYSDKYPDVVAVKEQIRTLEARLEEEKAREKKAAAAARAAEGRELRAPPQNPYVASLMSQLDQANVDAKTTAEEIANLNRQIAVYQRRLENTPRREQELAVLSRDYETTRELFRSLMAKREEAGIAADLEAVRKGETFRVVEAASVPERPAGPNRWRLLLVGLVLAVGTGAIAVVLAEQVDTSYRTVDEVRASVPVPVLSTIPKITTERDRARLARHRRWATAAVAVGLLAVIGSSFAVARNNDALVSLLTPAPAPAKR
jgi:polysaccharide chain length determinant protein (PEP-CTERM system associated)